MKKAIEVFINSSIVSVLWQASTDRAKRDLSKDINKKRHVAEKDYCYIKI
jgi:hypothetical protein